MEAIKISILIFFLLCSTVAISSESSLASARKRGHCAYETYAGKATVIGVEKTERSKAQVRVTGGPGYEGYEIWFSFQTDRETGLAGIRDITKKSHIFTLMNSWYPGEKYLLKYDIRVGRVYKGALNVIKFGPCSPVVFKFDDLDPTDYFETKE